MRNLKRRLLVTSLCSRTNFQYKLERRSMRWRAWGSSLLKICPHRYSQASKAHPHSAKVWSCTLFYFSTESLQWPATAFGSEVLHKTNGKYCHQKPACCNKSNLPLCQSPPSPVLGKQSNFCASQFFNFLHWPIFALSSPSTSSKWTLPSLLLHLSTLKRLP